MQFKIDSGNLTFWDGTKWDLIYLEGVNNFLGIFYLNENKKYYGMWGQVPRVGKWVFWFEGDGYYKTQIENYQITEVFVVKNEKIENLYSHMEDWFEKPKEFESNNPPLYSFYKDVKGRMQKDYKDNSILIENLLNKGTMTDLKNIDWSVKKNTNSNYITTLRNHIWPKKFFKEEEKEAFISDLNEQTKFLNRNTLAEKIVNKEIELIENEIEKIENNFNNFSSEDIKKVDSFLKKVERKSTDLNDLDNRIKSILGTNQRREKIFNKLRGDLSTIKSQLQNKRKELEIIFQKEQEEESNKKTVLDQLKTLEEGIQITMDRLCELCELEKRNIITIVKDLIKLQPDLGKYYDKQQVFVPGTKFLKEIDYLLEQFKKGPKKD